MVSGTGAGSAANRGCHRLNPLQEGRRDGLEKCETRAGGRRGKGSHGEKESEGGEERERTNEGRWDGEKADKDARRLEQDVS